MKKLLFALLMIAYASQSFGQQKQDSTELIRKSINDLFTYQTGTISLGQNIAKIDVPKGYRYLDAKQSAKVITEIWGNPTPSTPSLGMLFPENSGPADDGFAFNISFEEMGYVKDDDANSINYDDLLKEMKEGSQKNNEERTKNGFPTMDIVGWASVPYYDVQTHALHWAKEIKFGGQPIHTLNYNIRLLGRKGVLELNAIASIELLPIVKNSIKDVIASVTYEQGQKYKDFNPSIDQVAAYTVGGLVAGKVLAKLGLFALILKFWKIIALAFVAIGSILWRVLGNKKQETTPQELQNTPTTKENEENL